jgi:hypothetical protein
LVHGAHPLVSEDPDTQGDGGHQLEINTDWLRQQSAGRRIASLTYTYGASDTLDLYLSVPTTLGSPSGMNDVSAGVKWRFMDLDTYSFALKPELSLPTGDEMKSLGNGRASGTLTGVIAYDAKPWRLMANLGASINRYKLQSDRDANRSTTWRASASVWYAHGDRLMLVADTGIERDIDRKIESLPAFALVGAIYSPNPQLDLDAGIRFGLNCGQCSSQPRRQVGVGLTCRF